MAISDTQKVDYLWKKIGYGAAKTDTNANKKAPNEAIASPLIVRGDTIWSESDQIPGTIPTSSGDYVTVYSDALSTTIECDEDVTASTRRTWVVASSNTCHKTLYLTYQVDRRNDFGDIDPEIIRGRREGLTCHHYTPDLCGCGVGAYRAGGIAIGGLG